MMIFCQNSYQLVADYFQAGGPVMAPLLLVSLVMWLLIFNRLFFFRRLWNRDLDSQSALECIVGAATPDHHQYSGAVTLLVINYLRQRGSDRSQDRCIIDENVAWLNRRLDGCLAVIGVLAAIAPLLGLLGTVTGMIATFDVLAVFGTGNSRAMAGGISEALITTQTGLLVAIPGLYMHGYLTRRAQHLKQRIQWVGYYLRRHL